VQKHVTYDEDGDTFYDMIEENLKEENQALVSSDLKQAADGMASLRMYFCVERLNIIMQQDRV
jgi:hypothetical protein